MPRHTRAPRAVLIPLAASLFSPPIACAGITPQAQVIVDRYVEATGGQKALEAERGVHAKGRVEAGRLKGTFEQWTQVPDRLVMRLSLGPLKVRAGTDGPIGWETDLSSKRVRLLDAKELEKIQSDAYFENEMWARPSQGGGDVRHGASAYRSEGTFYSLEVTPPSGPSRRLWFSAKTGLLRRVVTRFDQGESDFWLSEYQTFQKRKRATVQAAAERSETVVLGESAPDHFSVDSVWASPRLDSTFFGPPASRESRVAWFKCRGAARIPFRYGSRHVWIKASINGAPPMDFLLDTGASGTSIDRAYAAQIGLIREGSFAVQGMGGSDEAAFARVGSIRVTAPGSGQGVELRDFRVGIVNLGEGHEEVLWRKMGGLIGYDFLSRFVVQIDYDTQVVTFRDPRIFEPPLDAAALEMKLLSGIPTVTAELDQGCSGQFLVDVGNGFGLVVHGSLTRRCGILRAVEKRKQVKVYGGGVGSSFASWLARIDSLSIGPFAIHEPIAGIALATRGMVGSKDLAGNIGNRVLERFRCTFDYGRRTLYLEPGKRFAERDRYSRAGVMFLREPHRVSAWEILHGSPADDAGLKADDEIVAIDGKPALDYTAEQMDRMFVDGEIGTSHTLTIVHDGKTSKVTLTLQDVI